MTITITSFYLLPNHETNSIFIFRNLFFFLFYIFGFLYTVQFNRHMYKVWVSERMYECECWKTNVTSFVVYSIGYSDFTVSVHYSRSIRLRWVHQSHSFIWMVLISFNTGQIVVFRFLAFLIAEKQTCTISSLTHSHEKQNLLIPIIKSMLLQEVLV